MEATKIELAEIDPRIDSKYSPNLLKWLRSWKRNYRHAATVYVLDDGRRYIGMVDRDGFFVGTNLNRALCVGARADIGCYGRINVEEVEGFWERYAAVGRCAIDPDHAHSFVGDKARWIVNGNTRSCQWCGNCVQEAHEKQITYVVKGWRNVEAVTA